MATTETTKNNLVVNKLTKSLYNDISSKATDETYFINDDGLAVAVDKLSNLKDTTISSVTNNQLLVYDSTSGKWVNNNSKLNFDESMIDLGTVSTDTTIDTTTGNCFKLTVGDDIEIDLSSNITTGASKTVSLLLVNAGDYTLTWTSKIRWSDDTAPTFTSGKLTLITFITFDGYNWFSTSLDKLTEIAVPWDWSRVVYQTSTAGRKFARHTSGMGTVMSMNDGTDRNILVLDAQYRTNGKAYYTDYSTNLNDTGNQLDLCTSTGTVSKNTTDSSFTSTYANQDTKTSYYNTQKLVDYNSTNSQAAAYCRSVTVNGTGCDLPNINVLCRIYAESAMLDSLDPTVSSYSSYSLASWSFGGRYGCWSSSWYGSNGRYYYALYLYDDGYVDYDDQDVPYGVCPVLEI